MITKEFADKIASAEGKIKGVAFKTDAEYVKATLGKESLEKLKNAMRDLGYPVDYEKVQAMKWYPIGVRVLHLELMKDLFNWGDNDIKKLGNAAPKYSLIIKLLMKFFISVEQMIKIAPVVTKRHYSIGELEVKEYNRQEQYILLHLKGLKIIYDSSAFSHFVEGYLSRGISYVLPGKEVVSSQRKFMQDNVPYVEYKIGWK